MRYQKIESQIWHDEKFIELTHLQQLLFFYILTSPHNNLIGTYVLKPGYICEDLNVKSVKRDMDKLVKLDLVRYDYKTGLIHIPNFFKHNPLTNPNQLKSAVKVWNRLPKCSLLLEVYEGLSEGLRQRLGKGLLKPETETEEEEETEKETVEEKLPSISVQDFVDGWNDVCGKNGFPEVKTLTPDRKDKIRNRLKIHKDINFWNTVFNKIVDTPFLAGRNDRKWKVTFNWLIANDDNSAKIYEGNYEQDGKKVWT